ncbi:MAG: tetratricopeptide repeat protein [Pyrinomonadaceae bacterium]
MKFKRFQTAVGGGLAWVGAPDPFGRAAVGPVAAAAVVLVCLWGTWHSGRSGLSKLYTAYGLAAGSLAHADGAVWLDGRDPEAHYARARLLTENDEFVKAEDELERARSLRPRDYVLWLELGLARERRRDAPGALAAFTEAARLAPHYAQPRWQLGNLWLRAGRPDEAFSELRRAATRDRALMLPAIELAWRVFGGDPAAVREAIKPQSGTAKLVLARFLIRRRRTEEGLSLFREAGGASSTERHQIINELLGTEHFAEAIELLQGTETAARDRQAIVGALLGAGRYAEAADVLRKAGSSERERSPALAALLSRQMFAEASGLLQGTNASDQERRLLLTGLLSAHRLQEAAEMIRTGKTSERERRIVLGEMIAAKKYAEAIELLRATGGASDQDWRAILTGVIAEKQYATAVELFRASGGAPERDRRAFVNALLDARRFGEAYELWRFGRGPEEGGRGGIADGGFEEQIGADDSGFGWHLPRQLREVSVAPERSPSGAGAQSLHVRWSGNVKSGTRIISQLVPVNPGARYRLEFRACTQDLVSAGLPLVTVAGAGGRDGVAAFLAQSAPLPEGTTGWRSYAVSFTAPPDSGAVVVALGRQSCPSPLCPIFGSTWLDEFSLREL